MNNILYKEFGTCAGSMPSFSPKVAKEIDIGSAIILNSIGVLILNASSCLNDKYNKDKDWIKISDGKIYVKMSYEQLDLFDLFSHEEISCLLQKLLDNGYIEIKDFFSESWYSTFQQDAYIKLGKINNE